MVLTMYKALLLLVVGVFLLLCFLVAACVSWPDIMGPVQYRKGFLNINLLFLIWTACSIAFAVVFRRTLYDHPRWYLWFCHSYAVASCIWSSALAAYADYLSEGITVLIYAWLCVSLVSLYRPWQALLAYGANYLIYIAMLFLFGHSVAFSLRETIYAGFATALSIIIAVVMHHYRTGQYYNNQIIVQQNQEINSINQRLQALVYTDDLTGARNRRFFEEVLPGKLLKIFAQQQSACVMMLDIDHFKQYNDKYGHQAGDITLRRVVEVMRRWVPEEKGDVVRYGGEEFLVLLPVAGRKEAQQVAEGICGGVESVHITHTATERGIVTVSIGVAGCKPTEPAALNQLTKWADEALYEAKRGGRDRIEIYGVQRQEASRQEES